MSKTKSTGTVLENRIKEPKSPLSFYSTITKDGVIMDIDRLTREELLREVARTYDYLEELREATERTNDILAKFYHEEN